MPLGYTCTHLFIIAKIAIKFAVYVIFFSDPVTTETFTTKHGRSKTTRTGWSKFETYKNR